MIRTQWNTLRIGDHVVVHDVNDDPMALVPGRVIRVDAAAGSNNVTIRLTPEHGPARQVTPSRLTVHLDAGDAAERCWRCEPSPPNPRRKRTNSRP